MKWYRIGASTEQLDAAARRRTLRERGESVHDLQTGRIYDQDRCSGTADLHGHLRAGPAGEDSGRGSPAGGAGPSGGRPAAGESKAGRRHRKQRRP